MNPTVSNKVPQVCESIRKSINRGTFRDELPKMSQPILMSKEKLDKTLASSLRCFANLKKTLAPPLRKAKIAIEFR